MLEIAVLHRHPFLFNQLSMAIHWTLQHKYHVHYLLHYLDDFFTARSPASDECSNNLITTLSLCEHINAPVKPPKIEFPSTYLSFLGIIITPQICKQVYHNNVSKIHCPYCCPLNLTANTQNSNLFHS